MRTLLFLAVILVCRPLAAVVIVDSAVLAPPVVFGDYQLRIKPAAGDSTYALVDIDTLNSTTFKIVNYAIAEEFRLYLAPAGTRLDPAFASAEPPFFTNAVFATPTFSVPIGQKLIISYWDDQTYLPPEIIPPNSLDNFGWLELQNNSGNLVIVRSATALGGGIIVGTLTQVPEPTSGCLVMSCTVAVLLRRLRRKRQKPEIVGAQV